MLNLKSSKSFTLIEVLVSIALLSVIVLFLYQSLDMTQKSNQFFSQKLKEQQNNLDLKEIFFKDIVSSFPKNTIVYDDKEKNSIVSLKTSNTYHNSFYQFITYFVSKKKNLLRCESKVKFNKDKLNDDFFNNAYIDTIASEVKKFKVIKKAEDKYAIYIKFVDETDIMFMLKSMR